MEDEIWRSHRGKTLFKYWVEEKYYDLTKPERKAADYMTQNQEELIYCSISDLAERAETSETTLVRICKKLGYGGFQNLKISVARELVTQQKFIYEELNADDDTGLIIEKTFNIIIQPLQ